MLIDSVGLFNLASKRMDYLSVRHTMIAQNVANADTPGYRSRDLKPFAAAMRNAGIGSLATTNPAHLAPAAVQTSFSEDARVKGWETAPSGNNVLLEEEMLKAADTSREYELASTLMRKHVSMMRATLNTRG